MGLQKSIMKKFNPNELFKNNYGTYIPTRRPQFKIHKTMGHAVNALKNVSVYVCISYSKKAIPKDCTLWKYTDKWEEVNYEHTYDVTSTGLKCI